MKTEIYVCTHKRFEVPKDPIFVPLQVGRAIKEDLGYTGDDTGDNISAKNPYYSELTGLYWAAKNRKDVDIKGSCHYRRYLLNDQGKVFSGAEIEDILKDYDLITTKTLTLRSDYYTGFSANHHVKDLELAGSVIRQKYPQYYQVFEDLVHKNETYFGNMIICRSALFDTYVDWLFSIFFEMEPQMDFTGYTDYSKRVYGFISEFLLKVYVIVNDLKVYETMVGMIGEKKETIEVRQKMAELIMEKRLTEAKEYFMSVAKVRPDILMEASDVNGELKLAMQIVSSCEHEYEAIGMSVLDRVSSYPELQHYFETLNRIMSDQKLGLQSDRNQKWLADHQVSEVAMKIAQMLQ